VSRSRSEREEDRARKAAEREEAKRAKKLAKDAVDISSRGRSTSRPPLKKPDALPIENLVAAAQAALGSENKVAAPKAKANSARMKASVGEIFDMANATFRGWAKAGAKDVIRPVPVK
jgi:hypothetical protein